MPIHIDLPCEEGIEDVQHGSAVLATVESNTHLLKAVGEGKGREREGIGMRK